MSKQFAYAARLVILPLLATFVLVFAIAIPLTARRASAQNTNQPQAQKPPKKKLGSGSNFQNYAQRDASNRLIAGGATRAVGDEALAVNQKAQEAYEAGKFEEAIAGFKRLTELKPTSAQAFYHLGVSNETAGHYKEAIEAYKKALAILDKADMNDDVKTLKAMSYYNMGNSLSADNQPAPAIESYKHVMTLLPDQPVVYNNIGLAYAASDQADEAVASFKKAIELDPKYAEAHFNLGLAYHILEDKAGEQAEIKTLEELNPELAAKLKGYKD
jgi:tetratricopeptide (TPR) repeat protein